MVSLALTVVLAVSSPRPVLAVLYFENQTGSADFDVMRKGLADMLVTDLAAYDGVTVVERSRLEDVMGELKLQQGAAFDAASRAKMGKLLGAQYVVVGEFSLMGSKTRLSARLVEPASGRVVGSAKVEGQRDALFDNEQKLVELLVSAIELKLIDASARRRARVASVDALLKYSQAVDLADQGKTAEAQAAIAAVVSASPTSALARDRKEAMAKAFVDSQAKRQDSQREALGQLAEAVESALKGKPSANDEVALRAAKHRLLAHAMTSHLPDTTSYRRVILAGHDAQALNVIRAIIDNLGRWRSAFERARTDMSFNPQLPEALRELARHAEPEPRADAFSDPLELEIRFALLGVLDVFAVGPAPVSLIANLETEQLAALDAELARRTVALGSINKTLAENQLANLLMFKGEVLTALLRDENAAQSYQRVLDQFPTSMQASRAEAKIKEMIDGGDHHRRQLDRWRKGLVSCDEMDLNVGSTEALGQAEQRAGRAGLRAMVTEAEKACLSKKPRALGAVYRQVAHEAATQNDCSFLDEAYQKAIEVGESAADAAAYAERWACPMAWLKDKPLARFTEDGSWSRELAQVSVITKAGRHTFVGQVPSGLLAQTFTLVAEPSGQCSVRWERASRPDGALLTSSGCSAKVLRDGHVVEVEFSASLPVKYRNIELTKGLFRALRQ